MKYFLIYFLWLAAACDSSESDSALAATDGSTSTDATNAADRSLIGDGTVKSDGSFTTGDATIKPLTDGGTRSAGCGVTGKPVGDFHVSGKDGKATKRDYEVLVPSPYNPATPLPVTFVYHGAGGAESDAKNFGIQNAPGALASSIFVFPQGIGFQSYGVGWDDGCGGYDMPFFDNMLAEIEADYCVDPARVFAAGFSWGCDQVTALTCCRGDRIRAVGAASCTDEFSDKANYKTYNNLPCPVQSSVAVRFTRDSSGGDTGYAAPLFTTTSELFQSWANCSSATSGVNPSPCVSYAGCTHPLIECPYPNLGHSIPGGWGNDTWDFFSGFH